MYKILSLLLMLCLPQWLAAQEVPTQAGATVPRLDVRLADGLTLEDIHQSKDTYRKCTVSIDGHVGFPDFAPTECNIKGRGNSTWAMAKKPYRLKFEKKQSLLGLPAGKSWVLLANFLDASQLNNPVAMYVARQVGAVGANHIVPVELYVNDRYCGLYNLTEQVGISSNSIKAANEETCALIELDEYDGKYNRDNFYRLPLSVKDPDTEDYEKLMAKKYKKLNDSNLPDEASYVQEQTKRFYEQLNSEFDALTYHVSEGTAESHIDIPSLVRYFLVNDLIGNFELLHPKSTYLHRQDIFDEKSPWVFGPVWDCDWASGYEESKNFCVNEPEFDYFSVVFTHKPGAQFFHALMRESKAVRSQYLALWKDYVGSGKLKQLLDYITAYQSFIAPATQRDYDLWKYRNYRLQSDYGPMAERMRSWLERRAHYILQNLEQEVPQSYTLTLGEEGMATLCLPFDWQVPEGMTVHRVKVITSEELNTDQVLSEGRVLAARTPVLVKAPAGEYVLEAFRSYYKPYNLSGRTNHLLGAYTNDPIAAAKDRKVYVFGVHPIHGPGFYPQEGTDGQSVSGQQYRAYLSVPTQQAPTVGFSLTGTINGLPTIAPNKGTQVAPIYDLSGRRVHHASPGIYIQQGRKVLR